MLDDRPDEDAFGSELCCLGADEDAHRRLFARDDAGLDVEHDLLRCPRGPWRPPEIYAQQGDQLAMTERGSEVVRWLVCVQRGTRISRSEPYSNRPAR